MKYSIKSLFLDFKVFNLLLSPMIEFKLECSKQATRYSYENESGCDNF